MQLFHDLVMRSSSTGQAVAVAAVLTVYNWPVLFSYSYNSRREISASAPSGPAISALIADGTHPGLSISANITFASIISVRGKNLTQTLLTADTDRIGDES